MKILRRECRAGMVNYRGMRSDGSKRGWGAHEKNRNGRKSYPISSNGLKDTVRNKINDVRKYGHQLHRKYLQTE